MAFSVTGALAPTKMPLPVPPPIAVTLRIVAVAGVPCAMETPDAFVPARQTLSVIDTLPVSRQALALRLLARTRAAAAPLASSSASPNAGSTWRSSRSLTVVDAPTSRNPKALRNTLGRAEPDWPWISTVNDVNTPPVIGAAADPWSPGSTITSSPPAALLTASRNPQGAAGVQAVPDPEGPA